MNGTRVPGAPSATVAPEKVRDYLLLPDHPDNDGKAIFFALFGFTRERWSELHSAQIAHPAANNVVRMAQTGDGTRYRVRCNLVGPDGRNPCITTIWGITTIWAVEPGQPPRLITAFPGRAP